MPQGSIWWSERDAHQVSAGCVHRRSCVHRRIQLRCLHTRHVSDYVLYLLSRPRLAARMLHFATLFDDTLRVMISGDTFPVYAPRNKC